MRTVTWALAVVVILAAVFLLGPRVPVDTAIRFDPRSIGEDPAAYLTTSEARFPDLREGLGKEIVWAGAPGERAPLAIVYLHGFSASKGEIRPLPDIVARELGANLFFTRLTGHGLGNAAMADGSINAWINDLAEAMAIARAIGDRTIVMATSTGGGLAIWAAANSSLLDDAAAMVLISPNLGIRAGGAGMLTMPWGGLAARLLLGAERGFEALNENQSRFWTTRYPTAAILPMARLTELAAATQFEDIEVPALFVFSDNDQVVRPDRTRAAAACWGAPHEMIVVNDSEHPVHHVIAGDAVSPSTTARLATATVEWLRRTLP